MSDPLGDMTFEQMPFFVQTDFMLGLRHDDCLKAIEILKD